MRRRIRRSLGGLWAARRPGCRVARPPARRPQADDPFPRMNARVLAYSKDRSIRVAMHPLPPDCFRHIGSAASWRLRGLGIEPAYRAAVPEHRLLVRARHTKVVA